MTRSYFVENLGEINRCFKSNLNSLLWCVLKQYNKYIVFFPAIWIVIAVIAFMSFFLEMEFMELPSAHSSTYLIVKAHTHFFSKARMVYQQVSVRVKYRLQLFFNRWHRIYLWCWSTFQFHFQIESINHSEQLRDVCFFSLFCPVIANEAHTHKKTSFANRKTYTFIFFAVCLPI